MKKTVTLFILLTIHLLCHAQGGVWTWVKGDTVRGQNIGILGVSNSANYPKGRATAKQWTDLNGNFWIFGGDYYNDLWKYDPVSNIWTWMKGDTFGGIVQSGIYGIMGIPGPNNQPGGRQGGEAWTDKQGHLWMYGGDGADKRGSVGDLDDLWMYDIPTNEWTWMQGADTLSYDYVSQVYSPAVYGALGVSAYSNTPGQRTDCGAMWVRSDGSLWLFGGGNGRFGLYSDMWRFDINSNMWTWMNGPRDTNSGYNFGVLGVESDTAHPPGGYSFSRWFDGNAQFYICNEGQTYKEFGDVWRYNSNNNKWTWLAGNGMLNDSGEFSQFCISDSVTRPGGSSYSGTTQSSACSNILWYLGGEHSDANASYTRINLMTFDIRTNQWTWVNGEGTNYMPPSYGTINVTSPSNTPGGQYGQCFWADQNNNLWAWGGFSLSSAMWKFVPDTACFHYAPFTAPISATISDNAICYGQSTLLSANSIVTGGTYIWSPGSDTSQSITVSPLLSITYTVTYNNQACGTAVDSVSVIVNPISKPSTIDTSICAGDSIKFGGSNYSSNGTYSHTFPNIYGCDSLVHLILSVRPVPSVAWSQNDSAKCQRITLLSGGSPSGGYYSGPYVHGDSIINPPGDTTFMLYYFYTDTTGCTGSGSLSFASTLCAGITDLDAASRIRLYPNPNNGSFILDAPQAVGSSYTIYDMLGRLIQQGIITAESIPISLSGSADGVYALTVHTSASSGTVRFTVVR